MKQFRIVKEMSEEFVGPGRDAEESWKWWIEERTKGLRWECFGWSPWRRVPGTTTTDEKRARERYILVVANQGSKIVVLEQPLEQVV